MPPGSTVLAAGYKHFLPGFIFTVGAAMIPKLTQSRQLKPLTRDYAREAFTKMNLAKCSYGDLPGQMALRIKADPQQVMSDIYSQFSAAGGAMDEALAESAVTQASGATPRIHAGGSADLTGHGDMSVTVVAASATLAAFAAAHPYGPLGLTAASFPGGGTSIPAEIQDDYQLVDRTQGSAAAAAVLKNYRDQGLWNATNLDKPQDNPYGLGSTACVDFRGHVTAMIDGNMVSMFHAFTTPWHTLAGWRAWCMIIKPDGQSVMFTVGAGQHPVSQGDRFNTEVGPLTFGVAHDRAVVHMDMMPDLVTRFGADKAAQGAANEDVYWAINRQLVAKNKTGVLIDEGMLFAGDRFFSRYLANARLNVPQGFAKIDSIETVLKLMNSTSDERGTAIVYAAQRAGQMPLDEGNLPAAPGPGSPDTIDLSQTLDISSHLPARTADPGNWAPGAAGAPWKQPVDVEDEDDPGPLAPPEPAGTPPKPIDPTNPYVADDPHTDDDPNNPEPEPKPDSGPEGPA